ncbi:MAG: VRR-NUC domain-containing protein [Actinomycetota bacterium]
MSVVFANPTEKQFQQSVVDLAQLLGWATFHSFDSRKSAAGFPDLVIVRDRVLFAELKTESGKLAPAQGDWLAALRAAGALVYVWRPSDWAEIQRELT